MRFHQNSIFSDFLASNMVGANKTERKCNLGWYNGEKCKKVSIKIY